MSPASPALSGGFFTMVPPWEALLLKGITQKGWVLHNRILGSMKTKRHLSKQIPFLFLILEADLPLKNLILLTGWPLPAFLVYSRLSVQLYSNSWLAIEHRRKRFTWEEFTDCLQLGQKLLQLQGVESEWDPPRPASKKLRYVLNLCWCHASRSTLERDAVCLLHLKSKPL